jgi:hypothetical protein
MVWNKPLNCNIFVLTGYRRCWSLSLEWRVLKYCRPQTSTSRDTCPWYLKTWRLTLPHGEVASKSIQLPHRYVYRVSHKEWVIKYCMFVYTKDRMCRMRHEVNERKALCAAYSACGRPSEFWIQRCSSLQRSSHRGLEIAVSRSV